MLDDIKFIVRAVIEGIIVIIMGALAIGSFGAVVFTAFMLLKGLLITVLEASGLLPLLVELGLYAI